MSDVQAGTVETSPSAPRADRGVAIAHVVVPVLVAAGFTRLLTGGWSWPLFASLLPLLGIGLRPAVWGVAARMRAGEKRRRVLYLERRDNAANVSLVTMSGLGLAIMDVFGLPGAPYWTRQPDAGIALAAVAVYLVWVATYSSVPDEVKRGWARLLGGKGGR